MTQEWIGKLTFELGTSQMSTHFGLYLVFVIPIQCVFEKRLSAKINAGTFHHKGRVVDAPVSQILLIPLWSLFYHKAQ